jgi:hypothetical protein
MITVTQHEKNEWSRLAKSAYASGRNEIGHRFSAAAALRNDESMEQDRFDELQSEYRAWLDASESFAEPKHTPGPWSVSPPIGEGDFAVLSKGVNAGGNFYVATLPNGSHAEAEANARLIAAAPELLRELKGFVSRWSFPKPPTGDDLRIYLDAARAAIAKAERGQS